ncbi:unnamed protein product [Cylindrotheca closterium]|uniref:Leucine-rich repeat domain-containing protein n=1 Tax=Cylindrotheca closterium TaxID=2856 RepID=A0AAD2CRN1_9STRA|nr:unnamed protein product [Cylindrotheca closterium]
MEETVNADQEENSNEIFVYTGQPGEEIPDNVAHVSVASSVTKIQDHDFRCWDKLVSVSISKTVQTIGESAFMECASLKKVELHRGLKVIGRYAFAECTALMDIELPDGLEEIGTGCFSKCFSLHDLFIPTTVETIEEDTFYSCVSLASVSLHDGITSIGKDAFDNCASLLALDIPRGMTRIESGTFRSCELLRKVSIPTNVTSIGEDAFTDCTSLAEIDFHEGLKHIGNMSFARCTSLSTIAFPSSLEEIESRAFWRCSSLLGFEIPSDTKGVKINEDCFMGCESLITFSISDDSVKDVATNDNIQGLVLSEFFGTKTACRNRWTDFPIHELCYHSSRTTVEELVAAFDASETLKDILGDTMGMTPFHIVATSPNPRVEIVQCLLDRYPLMALVHKDTQSKTMMDYLLTNGSSQVIPLIRLVFQTAIADRVSGWSPVWNERFDLSRHIRSMIRSDDDTKQRRKKLVFQLLEHVGQCIRKETTSLMELSLWKMKMDTTNMVGTVTDDISYRESCRLQCGADIVVDNVLEYLIDIEESKCSPALSVFPLCSLASLTE